MTQQKPFDVIVIGAGPAGLAASYALRPYLRIVIIAPDLCGKAGERMHLPWLPHGCETSNVALHWHDALLDDPHVTIVMDRVVGVAAQDDCYRVRTSQGEAYYGRAVIVACGVRPNVLGVPGEQRLACYGLSYSAISHAKLFQGRRVVVVGGAERALQAVARLSEFTSAITLVAPERAILEDTPLGLDVLRDPMVCVYSPATVLEIQGGLYVTSVTITNGAGQPRRIPTDGVFVELGLTAHTAFLGDLVKRLPNGQIRVDDQGATCSPGLFATGDVANTPNVENRLLALDNGAHVGLHAYSYLAQRAYV